MIARMARIFFHAIHYGTRIFRITLMARIFFPWHRRDVQLYVSTIVRLCNSLCHPEVRRISTRYCYRTRIFRITLMARILRWEKWLRVFVREH